jgi:hypothetical protein
MKKSQQCINSFQKSQQLKDWLAYFSALAWEKLDKYKKYPTILSVGEVCINELFVDSILDSILEYNLPIRFFHAKDETSNGNDFEILLPYDRKHYLLFPCQAKKLYKNKRYSAILHHVGKQKREQILYLLDYAKKVGGFPLYFLYNYTPENFNPNDCNKYLGYEKEMFGCTMISAFHLKDNFLKPNQRMKQMSFSDIHPPSIPLVKLADLYKKNFVVPEILLEVFGEVKYKKHEKALDNMVGYTMNQLINKEVVDKEWLEIHPIDKKRYVGIDIKPLKSQTENEEYIGFNPKYRIIFTHEMIVSKNRLNSFI